MGSDDLAKIRTIQAPLVTWSVLLPGEGQVELTLLESCPFPEYIPVGQRIEDGSGGVKVNERDFKTDLKTFDITGPGIGGSMVIFKHQILASIRYNNRLFELRPTDLRHRITSVRLTMYYLMSMTAEETVTLVVPLMISLKKKWRRFASQKSMVLECVEIAIDIDKYTYDTFGDCDAAINWSLAILAGVDEIYRHHE